MNPHIYILYHANCRDGFGAAFAAWTHLKNDKNAIVEYIPYQHGNPVPEMRPGANVFILDFSFPATILLDLGLRHEAVFVLDHHATAQKDLSLDSFCQVYPGKKSDIVSCWNFPDDGFNHVNNIFVRFDMNKSGAVLAWEYFNPDQLVPLLIQYIQDRDLWKFQLPYSKAVSAYLELCGYNFDHWDYLMHEYEKPDVLNRICVDGLLCMKVKEAAVNEMAKRSNAMLFDIGGNPPQISHSTSPECFENQFIVPTANATCFFSEVGERLLELHSESKFSAYYFDRSDGKRIWGLRSRADFDCSIISKAFGGGGHKQASGFVTDMPL